MWRPFPSVCSSPVDHMPGARSTLDSSYCPRPHPEKLSPVLACLQARERAQGTVSVSAGISGSAPHLVVYPKTEGPASVAPRPTTARHLGHPSTCVSHMTWPCTLTRRVNCAGWYGTSCIERRRRARFAPCYTMHTRAHLGRLQHHCCRCHRRPLYVPGRLQGCAESAFET